jgi:hypothetical protein
MNPTSRKNISPIEASLDEKLQRLTEELASLHANHDTVMKQVQEQASDHQSALRQTELILSKVLAGQELSAEDRDAIQHLLHPQSHLHLNPQPHPQHPHPHPHSQPDAEPEPEPEPEPHAHAHAHSANSSVDMTAANHGTLIVYYFSFSFFFSPSFEKLLERCFRLNRAFFLIFVGAVQAQAQAQA